MTHDPESPMRVSAWNAPGGTTVPVESPRPAMPAPREPSQPGAPEEEGGSPGFLAIDPIRLLSGVWKRRWWILAGLLIGAGGGLAFGVLKAKTRYEVSVSLMKLNLPTTFRVGETGDSYHPQQLSNATLVSAASSYNVLQRVVQNTDQPISVGLLQNSIVVKDERNSDIINLTLSGYTSEAATVSLANLWAREVVGFSKDMQTGEARKMREFLQKQVDATDADLGRLNQEILDYSRKENIVDSDKEIDSNLRSLGDIELRYQTAKINLDTIDYKIKSTEEELRRQSPIADQLKIARADLDNLRTRYTDENPLVSAQLDKIRELEQQLEKQTAAVAGNDAQYAGTFLGNTLYLKLLDLQNEKKGLEHERLALEKLRGDTQANLSRIPEKSAIMAQMVQKRQALTTGRNLLFSRLREAELYESNAPGFYQIFSAASVERVAVKSKSLKIVAFSAAGAVGGMGLVIVLALGLELADFRVRRGAELQKLLAAPLLATFKKKDTGVERAKAAGEIWSRWIGGKVKTRTVRVIWSPVPSAQEALFWDPILLEAADLLAEIQVIDCLDLTHGIALPHGPEVGRDARIRLETCDITRLSIAQAEALVAAWQEASRRGRQVWIRLGGPVQEPGSTLARAGDGILVLGALHEESSSFWRAQADLMRKTTGKILGVVSVDERDWREW